MGVLEDHPAPTFPGAGSLQATLLLTLPHSGDLLGTGGVCNPGLHGLNIQKGFALLFLHTHTHTHALYLFLSKIPVL